MECEKNQNQNDEITGEKRSLETFFLKENETRERADIVFKGNYKQKNPYWSTFNFSNTPTPKMQEKINAIGIWREICASMLYLCENHLGKKPNDISFRKEIYGEADVDTRYGESRVSWGKRIRENWDLFSRWFYIIETHFQSFSPTSINQIQRLSNEFVVKHKEEYLHFYQINHLLEGFENSPYGVDYDTWSSRLFL